MGLPRYLATKFALEQRQASEVEKSRLLLCAGADFCTLVFPLFQKEDKAGRVLNPARVISSFQKGRWADVEFRRFKQTACDDLERVNAKLYIGLQEHTGGVHTADFRDVEVPRFIVDTLTAHNVERERRDREQVNLQLRIALIRNKVYASRCFPAKLRAIIFERDGYRCRNCVRDRAKLEKLGLHLEVDHIKAFVDGGKTTYANGITLCNECNGAKHHTKWYFKALDRLSPG